ncbi:hypothetical protein [uncultured Brachyspira sp.]|uniref:hypothetical protein n=1 Tax=uncultured Brachyspira sp. TaxID=221953 RepID=UPI0026334D02|nr:hypothetical protein [uncultured Brachyspira sp.]
MKIYLDQNIITRLDGNILDKIQLSRKKGYKYFYSFGHIYDLLSAEEIYWLDELKKIERVTDNNMVRIIENKNKLIPYNVFPTSHIEKMKCNQNDILNYNIFDINSIDDYILKKFNIRDIEIRNKLVISTNNMLNIMKSSNDYKDLRNKLKTENVSLDEFKYILNETSIKTFNNNMMAIMSSIYDFIDILDENYDNLKEKLKMNIKNINGDFYHCLHATYCDYFVTNDNKLLNKAIFVYDLMNQDFIRKKININYIKTISISLNDFEKILYQLK